MEISLDVTRRMSGTQRGKDDSKELVLCTHCSDFRTRNDNLARHTEKQHPGLQPKWKRIVKQTTRMTDFFGKVNKESAEAESSVEGKEVQNVELEDMKETVETETVDAPNNNVTEVTEDSLKRVADENENSKRQKTIPDTHNPGQNH